MYRNRYYNGDALESMTESMMVTRDGRLIDDENEYCEYDSYNYHKDAIHKMEGGLYNGEDLMSKSVAKYLSEIRGKRTTLDEVKEHIELCTVNPSVYIDEEMRTLEIWYCYAPARIGVTYKGSDYNTSHFSVGLVLDDPDCLVTGNWRYGYSPGKDDLNRHIYESVNSEVPHYTVQGSIGEYTRGRGSMYQGLWYLDSDHNIFPSEQACARFHGVGAAAVENPRGFFSKTLQKKMAAHAIKCFDTALLGDDGRLAVMLGKYDELFNDYMLKGIRATMVTGPDGNEIRPYKRVTLPDGVTKVWSPCYESTVYESQRYFKLHDDERRALATEMGLACGDLGEDWETEKYRPFMDTLTPGEREQFSQCVDFLENEETYAYVSSRNLAPDLPIVRRFLEWMNDNDMFGENWDLMDAFGKICDR